MCRHLPELVEIVGMGFRTEDRPRPTEPCSLVELVLRTRNAEFRAELPGCDFNLRVFRSRGDTQNGCEDKTCKLTH